MSGTGTLMGINDYAGFANTLMRNHCWMMWPNSTMPNIFAQTIPRQFLQGNQSIAPSGTPIVTGGIILQAGDAVSSITMISATTAAGTPTHQWFCITDMSGNILGITTDDTSTAWAANTAKTLNLTSPLTVFAPTAILVGCCITATTSPTILGGGGPITVPLAFAPHGTAGGFTGAAPAVGTSIGTLVNNGTSLWAGLA